MQPASIGSYQIIRELGRGGMGEVFLARDSRLDRQVAIKSLPAHLAADPDRLARFQREAKILASLNHPGIGAIYGLEEASGHQYLILEYVEGETLAELIKRGAIPADEALAIARQIAEALEVAHEKGIIHRDLKPGNVMVTSDGIVKVLDFGLARTDPSPSSSTTGAGPMDSPTLATPRHSPTIPGVILGTAGYMSPEQARGKSVDKRSDIFSFGCVLYEMLAGNMPFPGETVTDSLGALLHREPEWELLPKDTPPRIRELLASCMVKDRKQRLHDIGDARLAIENANKPWSDASTASAPARSWLPWIAAAAVCAIVCTGMWFKLGAKESEPLPVVRSLIEIPPGYLIDEGDGPVALSPDGRTLAFVGGAQADTSRIWIRPMDSISAQPLQGTDDATYPFWSPDGKNIGFFSKGKLRRIPATGGTAISIADAPNPRGGSWSTDGTIVFAPEPFGGLKRVAASGGTPSALTEVENEFQTHRLPSFLPDGRHLLYTSLFISAKDTACEIMLMELASGKSTPLVKEQSQGFYSPPGFLVFVHDSKLMAQRLDLSKAALVGEATVLAENVSMNSNRYTGAISVSLQGTMVYRPSRTLSRLQWFDIEGRPQARVGEPANFTGLSLSPSGEQVAAIIKREDGKFEIWIYDTLRGSRIKFAEDVGLSGLAWSPSGDRIAYSDRNAMCHIRLTEGEMKDVVLTAGYPTDWSRDGNQLCITRQDPKTQMDLYLADAVGGEPRPLRRTNEDEMFGFFSPDSKWVCFIARQSAKMELMVVPATGNKPGRAVAPSIEAEFGFWCDDGTILAWSASGKNLYTVPTKITENGIEFGSPKPVFGGMELPAGSFAISQDGMRILSGVPVDKDKTESLVLLQNWLSAISSSR